MVIHVGFLEGTPYRLQAETFSSLRSVIDRASTGPGKVPAIERQLSSTSSSLLKRRAPPVPPPPSSSQGGAAATHRVTVMNKQLQKVMIR